MNERERYLFRGKREKDEQWEYGAFWQSNSSIIDKSGYSQKVVPETVGQCIGLKDKNGKLIFEGDIVERYSYYDDIWEFSYTAKCYGVIVWNTNDYCWNIKTNDELMPFNDYDWGISMVVGNIHDNPELLEVKE